MNNLLNFEFRRLIRSKIIFLAIVLILLIGVLGLVLDRVFYDNIGTSEQHMMSIFNAFTQFNYLIIGFLFVQSFAKDYSKGIVNFYKQMGYSLYKQNITKAISLLLVVIPCIDLFVIATYFLYGNIKWEFFVLMIVIIDIATIYIALLAMLVSSLSKSMITSVLIFFALFVILDIMNLLGYGLFNPADGNSLSAYLLCRYTDRPIVHYTIDKVFENIQRMEYVLAVIPALLDCVVLFVFNYISLSKKHI